MNHDLVMEYMVTFAKMTVLTGIYIGVTFFTWAAVHDKELSAMERVAIGVIYGIMAILSTHFGVDFKTSVINVRDLGPMCAGLFFNPMSGIIAGLIGGIERYIAGTYFGVGSFTTLACSLSTILAGVLAAFANSALFEGRRPTVPYAFFLGAVIEVFHMYMVFITHGNEMDMAFLTVRICALPMIFFNACGVALSSVAISYEKGELRNPFRNRPASEVPVAHRFQIMLFVVTMAVFILSYAFNYSMQTQTALQESRDEIELSSGDIREMYDMINANGGDVSSLRRHVGERGFFFIYKNDGTLTSNEDFSDEFGDEIRTIIGTERGGVFFTPNINGVNFLARIDEYEDLTKVLIMIPAEEVFRYRNIQGYETLFGDILVFTAIFMLISLLIKKIITDKLELVNNSLDKITNGDLNERVNVYSCAEFASLSDDINETVDVLKGYIEDARKKMEQELILARTIQDAALPKNFDLNNPAFELYATMDPAREVGGDFYDFFFVDNDKLALVIADVSGKGIPAALFMMRSKTAIRGIAETGASLSEVLARVNEELCDGNDANMFVTVWICTIDLRTGVVKCVNAGHEYPVVKQGGGKYEILKDRHTAPLGVIEVMTFTEYDLHLEPGDCLYVYTDGVPEAINTEEEQYDLDRMLKVLNRNSNESEKVKLKSVKRDLDGFVGEAEQFDDITMVGFRFNGYGKDAR